MRAFLDSDKPVFSTMSLDVHGGREVLPLGVLLLDRKEDRLYLRFREDLAELVGPDELNVLAGISETIVQMAAEEGATGLFVRFLDTLSNKIRISEPTAVAYPDEGWQSTLDRLFKQHVIAKPAGRTG
jgi:hypothetical protein